MTRESITEKVCAAFVEALGLDEDEVTPESRIFDDLGAESLDLLEIVFLLERGFDIKIPRGGIESAARADMARRPTRSTACSPTRPSSASPRRCRRSRRVS